MADITKLNYDTADFHKLKTLKNGRNWPVVYLLKNRTEIYIGESTNAYNRFKQHHDNPSRLLLNEAYIVADSSYNISATKDTESLLIQYIAADGKYELQNGNDGLIDHNYYEKEKYRADFEGLWEQLRALRLVDHELIQLKNSDLFKYSPYKALSDEQLSVVEAINTRLMLMEQGSFIVNGEPGTGKTILGVYLVKYLQEKHKVDPLKIAMVVPVTALRKTLKKVFSQVKGLKSSMVIGPNEVVNGNYDLLIVDEAHRLKRRVNLTNYATHDISNKHFGLGNEGTQLDWIERSSRYQILLYDENQTVMPTDVRPKQIKELKALEYKLTSQMRVQGGEDYLKFVNDILDIKAQVKFHSDNYRFVICDTIKQLKTSIAEHEKESGLSRIVAGYAWEWKTKNATGPDKFDIEIEGEQFKWNSVNIDWVNSANANQEVGCIHTIQGYDLNYAGVIIGSEMSYDPVTKKLIIDKNKYKDFNGKRTIENLDELEDYIRNIYKTLLTRGILGTYVYAVDPELRKYLQTVQK